LTHFKPLSTLLNSRSMFLLISLLRPNSALSGQTLFSNSYILFFLLLPCAQAMAQAIVYSPPIVIKKGGTYRGNWESLDSSVPAVMVDTPEPVIIENANIRSAGHAIRHTANADLTIRNCRATGLLPSIDGVMHGRFLVSRRPYNLIVENNYFENTSGILVHEFSASAPAWGTIKIMRNKARNINGKHRDGVNSTIANFVQFNQVVQLRNIEIAWNEVINEPGKSVVEDNINMYNSSGVAGSPLRIHNNFIWGGYPVNPLASSYTGGGIITDGSGTGKFACAYVHAFENVVVSTTNYGMGIAAGNNNQYYNNRVISSGVFADGARIPAQHAGIWLRNYYKLSDSDWYNNANRNNVIAWVRFGTTLPDQFPDRHDISRNACENCPNNTHLPNPVPYRLEEEEYQAWLLRCKTANVLVGPTSAPIPATLTSLAHKPKEAAAIKLYPNPAGDRLFLDLPEKVRGKATVTIADGLGRTFYAAEQTIETYSSTIMINLTGSSMGPGVYYVRVNAEEMVQVIRFAKK
jgi:endo-chitodextinase